MAGKSHPDTARGLALIAGGVPVREAAAQVNVAPSTLSRALKRSGAAPRKAGRPATKPAEA